MPIPVWLIEADVFGRSFEPIKSEIRSQGMACEVVHARPFLNGVTPRVAGQPLADGDCVLFSGTYPLFRHIQLHHKWIPGGWCNAEEFDCARYYPILGPQLVNHDCLMLPIDEALARPDAIFEQLGQDGQVFLRPCPVQKIFTGRCVARDEFDLALRSARYAQCQVLVARPRPMDTEWRLVVAGDNVVAASQYRRAGALVVAPGCPNEVGSFAQGILATTPWRPDPIFLMDVCASDGALRLIELNSFSCSGLYECEPRAIVATVRRLALEAWERAQAELA